MRILFILLSIGHVYGQGQCYDKTNVITAEENSWSTGAMIDLDIPLQANAHLTDEATIEITFDVRDQNGIDLAVAVNQVIHPLDSVVASSGNTFTFSFKSSFVSNVESSATIELQFQLAFSGSGNPTVNVGEVELCEGGDIPEPIVIPDVPVQCVSVAPAYEITDKWNNRGFANSNIMFSTAPKVVGYGNYLYIGYDKPVNVNAWNPVGAVVEMDEDLNVCQNADGCGNKHFRYEVQDFFQNKNELELTLEQQLEYAGSDADANLPRVTYQYQCKNAMKVGCTGMCGASTTLTPPNLTGVSECSGYGDPHYTTFDGEHLEWQGTCPVTLSSSECWSVQAQNVDCSGAENAEHQVSCLEKVWINIDGAEISVSVGPKERV
jgi:hypothetical protein